MALESPDPNDVPQTSRGQTRRMNMTSISRIGRLVRRPSLSSRFCFCIAVWFLLGATPVVFAQQNDDGVYFVQSISEMELTDAEGVKTSLSDDRFWRLGANPWARVVLTQQGEAYLQRGQSNRFFVPSERGNDRETIKLAIRLDEPAVVSGYSISLLCGQIHW